MLDETLDDEKMEALFALMYYGGLSLEAVASLPDGHLKTAAIRCLKVQLFEEQYGSP